MDERPADRDFYVGYLPVPRDVKRFLRLAVPLAAWLLLVAALAAAWTQRDPGPAVWDTGRARSFTGTLFGGPYPILLAEDAGEGRPGPLLIVEPGKRGSGERLLGLEGRRVTLSGWPLHREGRRMLELEPGESAVRDEGAARVDVGPARPIGVASLRGEIVDSKCFLGAMKPGEGRTHKECAMLCIRGGIPAMLLTRDAAGNPSFYLIVSETLGPIHDSLVPFVGEPVEVRGEVEEFSGLRRIRVAANGVKRL